MYIKYDKKRWDKYREEKNTREERDALIVRLRMLTGGFSLQVIGDLFGLSRERIRQIVKSHTIK